ncbi:hypothetical protein [Alkalimarinus sediminis]|uniref:Uncharacterized protein n=1 Tax=Alkalimarinus sediminis TaxID=1632866 RepID=A0A9E8KKQ1_9ALTE|nr:hypothetical protein [Alkalimarinus sediminis]UZW76416.1 hypothetical protein NNL22_07455 [Alkalimarinus sediminis]
MADLHIEDFFKDAAKILNQLYLNFPKKSSVFVEDISGEDTPDEYGLHAPRHQACFGCMLWLSEEGYLRFESTIRQDAIDQAVLTQKSFSLLSRVCNDPKIIELAERSGDPLNNTPSDLQTNINLIRKIQRKGTSTQLAEAMQRLLFRE